MDIFIDDLIFSLQKAGGISVYWSEIMKRMNTVNNEFTYNCLQTKESQNILSENIYWKQKIKADNILPLLAKRFLPVIGHLPEKSIYHSSYLRWSRQKDVVNIMTIHDLAPEMGLIEGNGKLIRKWQQQKAIQQADGILCVSETMRKDLLDYYSFLKPEKVKAVYHGISASFFSMETKEEKPYILFVGHRSGYKNFELAVDVVAALPNMQLMIVGGKELSSKEYPMLNKKLGNRFEFKGTVAVDVLNELYNNAFCLLYPSSYEGFGLPIIEAMKVGCPVVTTNKAAIPEVAGNGALQVNSFDVNDFVNAIQALHKSSTRQQLIEEGKKQAMNFSWDTCFTETINFYKEIYNQKFNS